MNGIDWFDRGCALAPEAPCMIDAVTGRSYPYREIRRLTLRNAAALHRRDYRVGARAAVLSTNDALGYTAVLSLLRAGITWLPLNPRNATAETAAILEAFDCELLLFLGRFAEAAHALRAQLPRLRELVCIDTADTGFPSLDDWAAGDVDEAFDLPHDPERLFAIQATGGTTGTPKGVMLPNRAVEYIVASMMAIAPCDAPPVFLAVAPLTHAAGMMFQYVLAQGGTGILFPSVDRRRVLEAIPRYRASHLFLPPTLIYDLLSEPGVRTLDYSSLRCLCYGAAPMAPDKLREALEVFGPVMCQVYGQTEVGFPVTAMRPADHFVDGALAPLARLASCGRVAPFARVALMDDDGRLLPDGEIGEIVVRGQGLMTGYYKDPAATEAAWRGHWHHTGDVAWRDADGYYYIVDRKKDMIISGGFNIYSAEVERAVLAHPAVQDCAVIGVPDARWGEAVKAVVELKPGMRVAADEIIATCRERIGGMKAPKSVDFVEQLPRSAVGKVLKREVRRPYWEGRERNVS